MDSECDEVAQSVSSEEAMLGASQSGRETLASSSGSSSSTSFQVFKGAVGKAINKVTAKNRIFAHFKHHFEDLYRKDSEKVIEIYKSMMDQLKTMINEDIDLQLDCNHVEQLLDDLDTVKRDQRREKSWRPSGDAQKDLQAHLHQCREMELEHLEKIYRSILSKNSLLNSSLDRAQQQILSRMQQIDECSQEWEEAASAIPESTRKEIVNITLGLPCLVKSDYTP